MNMKNKLTLLSLSLFFLIGCTKNDSPISFNMAYTSEVTIPSSTGINLPFNLITPDIETNTEATCEVNNTRKNLIKSIFVKDLILTIIVPEGEDFSFLKSIQIFLNADGLSETRIAWNENVSADAASPLSLNIAGDDISEYIKKDQFSLKCTTVTDELIATDYKIGVASNFKVNAVLFK